MTFSLNQIFDTTYPPEAAQFCNQNGYRMVEIDKQDGKRRFQIQEIPAPTEAEQAEKRKQEILAELDRIDRASSRALRACMAARNVGNEPASEDVLKLAEYEAKALALREEMAGLEPREDVPAEETEEVCRGRRSDRA